MNVKNTIMKNVRESVSTHDLSGFFTAEDFARRYATAKVGKSNSIGMTPVEIERISSAMVGKSVG